ncbi:phage tail assembly protein [Pseudomonas putida]|uniref:phage tail assembly protein n=1 Tax=Pseudomonas putida TaxID=303 RepID=UPI0034D3E079
MSKKVPSYIELTEDHAIITLTKPSEMNGVKVDKVTLRAPTVREMRISSKTAGGDEEQIELNLFASLAEVGIQDLDNLTIKNYNRISTGYTFLVREDEL